MEKSWPIIFFLLAIAMLVVPHTVTVEIKESKAEAEVRSVIKQSNVVFGAILKKLQEHDKALGLNKKKEEVKVK